MLTIRNEDNAIMKANQKEKKILDAVDNGYYGPDADLLMANIWNELPEDVKAVMKVQSPQEYKRLERKYDHG
jgi:hypothetical protein